MMRKINGTAKKVLNKILCKMGENERLLITNTRNEINIICTKLSKKFYLLGNCILLNEIKMSLPEIVFYYNNNEFYPVSLNNDSSDKVIKESVKFLSNGSYNLKIQKQKEQTKFANQWLIYLNEFID